MPKWSSSRTCRPSRGLQPLTTLWKSVFWYFKYNGSRPSFLRALEGSRCFGEIKPLPMFCSSSGLPSGFPACTSTSARQRPQLQSLEQVPASSSHHAQQRKRPLLVCWCLFGVHYPHTVALGDSFIITNMHLYVQSLIVFMNLAASDSLLFTPPWLELPTLSINTKHQLVVVMGHPLLDTDQKSSAKGNPWSSL